MTKYDIYLIWGKNSDGDILRYYGSTANFIKRKSYHKNNYQRWVNAGRPNNRKYSCFIVLDNGDWKMEKIDEIEGDRWEARKLEGEYQKNNVCVNVRIECRTQKEYQLANKDAIAEQNKEYRIANKDIIIKKNKEYRIAHRDEIKKKKKEYHLAHRDEILKKNKEKYNLNKDKILEKQKEKITCECGAEVTKKYIAVHRRSKKHINLLNSN